MIGAQSHCPYMKNIHTSSVLPTRRPCAICVTSVDPSMGQQGLVAVHLLCIDSASLVCSSYIHAITVHLTAVAHSTGLPTGEVLLTSVHTEVHRCSQSARSAQTGTLTKDQKSPYWPSMKLQKAGQSRCCKRSRVVLQQVNQAMPTTKYPD